MTTENNFVKLASVDVGKHIEKKNGLSYLSWAWAVDQLLRRDPLATWEYKEPVRWGDTVMVFCTVTAFGKPMTAQLPVMDHRNKAIANPDAFAVNNAMQRCLAKAIALHGLGLYIYTGEDLPEVEATPVTEDTKKAISILCGDGDVATKLQRALEKKGVKSVAELSESDAQKLLKWLTA
jgi:hypothetical protein